MSVSPKLPHILLPLSPLPHPPLEWQLDSSVSADDSMRGVSDTLVCCQPESLCAHFCVGWAWGPSLHPAGGWERRGSSCIGKWHTLFLSCWVQCLPLPSASAFPLLKLCMCVCVCGGYVQPGRGIEGDSQSSLFQFRSQKMIRFFTTPRSRSVGTFIAFLLFGGQEKAKDEGWG